MIKLKRTLTVLFLSLFASNIVLAQSFHEEETLEGFNFTPLSIKAPQKRRVGKQMVAHRGQADAFEVDSPMQADDQGKVVHLDGTCFNTVVYDHGYTPVTIDAQGTLAQMKNNITERVQVSC